MLTFAWSGRPYASATRSGTGIHAQRYPLQSRLQGHKLLFSLSKAYMTPQSANAKAVSTCAHLCLEHWRADAACRAGCNQKTLKSWLNVWVPIPETNKVSCRTATKVDGTQLLR